MPSSPTAEQQMRRLSRRSFAVAGGAAAVGFAGWLWLKLQAQNAGIPWFLRKTLNFNAKVAQAYFSSSRLSPVYSADQARDPRANGQFGLADPKFNPAQWKLKVEMPAGKASRGFSLDDIKTLPRAEMITELKCIEGWSVVVQWAGARLADFLSAHNLGLRDPNAPASPGNLFDFVQLETPDRGYYVGLDMASAMHPQTLLCYELNGKPLPLEHGAPLRLVIPVKYGIKNIKRIGTIRFLDSRPADYWAERGYDWYAGL
ncbi:MAG TPA: molybdopterin-dependent oxidoreductase [Pirellulales bacterium]|nr:molybdopterin-dependent oxidoreductase [Pirellulales bacterium]